MVWPRSSARALAYWAFAEAGTQLSFAGQVLNDGVMLSLGAAITPWTTSTPWTLFAVGLVVLATGTLLVLAGGRALKVVLYSFFGYGLFVMLHMGHGHGVYIQAAINTAKRYDNIILETSGMPMHTKVKEAVKEIGDERVVFGSDYPFHHHSVELQRIQMAGLTRKEMERVLYDNAASQLV